jgi:serine/threonine-protein kinase HipA
MTERVLQAYINHRKVGELSDTNGVWSFAYAGEWAADPGAYPISPALSFSRNPIVDSSSTRPVQWYFDNLLPEESARTLLAKDAEINVADAFGLLAWYGAESAGSLTLLDSSPVPAPEAARPLPDAELQKRIQNLPRVSLAAGAPKRMSVAGAQHKLAVIYRRDNAVFEPIGHTPSTHILKPDNKDEDYPHTVINEYFVMRLGRALRLTVPAVTRRYVPAPAYLVERFDRAPAAADGTVARRHLIDACQALNLDRQFKYTQGSIEHLAKLADTCVSKAAARLRIYSWLVFNVLTGNSDAHLKNLSFLVDSRGIELAPCYDLVAIGVYDSPSYDHHTWPATKLAWPLCGSGTFADLSRDILVDAGQELGLSTEVAQRLLDTQVKRIEKAARAILAEVEAENVEMLKTRPELAATFAGETRCLRAIIEVVVREMARRLGSPGRASQGRAE